MTHITIHNLRSVDQVRANSALTPWQTLCINLRHLLFRQLEAKHICIVLDALWVIALWQRDETMLEGPANQDLGG